jgi:hypothetical protein
MIAFRCLLPWGIASALASALPAAQDQSIAVSASAIAEYVRPVDPAGGFRPESYVFAAGQFFEGGTMDRGLVRTGFADITRTLAANLAKQNYFPAVSPEAADLLIMVHWGTTTIYVDPQREFNNADLQNATSAYNASIEASGKADPTQLNMALDAQDTARAGVADSIYRNALLLGYSRYLVRERRALDPTTAEITMSNELNEERYFVILMAYDNRMRLKERKSKLLWVTRLSVRSPGNNFVEALPALAQIGADVFGRQIDELVRVNSPIRHGSVRLGELEIIGPVEGKTPPPPPGK